MCISRTEIRFSVTMAEGTSLGTEVPVSNTVTETEVRVSGVDTGAVVPVGTAATTSTTLSETNIAIIVDRVTKNLQLSVSGGTLVCPASSEGEGEAVVPLLWLCGGRLCKAACALVRFVRCGTVLGGDLVCEKREQ